MEQARIKQVVTKECTCMFEAILDYAAVAIPNDEQYKKYRSKVLRYGNNCIRNIHKAVADTWFTINEVK